MWIVDAISVGANIWQFWTAFNTDDTLRVHAQSDYYYWHEIGDLAGQLKQNPASADKVAEALIKLSHAHQARVLNFAQGKLNFTPVPQEPWNPKPRPKGPGFRRRVLAALHAK